MKKYIPITEMLWFQEGPGVRNTQYTTSGVKLLNVANLIDGELDITNTERYISEDEAYGKYKHFLVDDGDFIIASSGIKVEYFDRKMGFAKKEQLPLCMNTSTIRFKVLNKEKLSIRYFMYYLKSDHFKAQLNYQITGSAQLNFGPSHLKKMVFPIVEIATQNQITEKLDTLCNIESRMRQEIELLDELVKSRFIELFGDPVDNEMQWPTKSLEEACRVIVDCPHSTPNYTSQNTGFMCIRTSIVKKNYIIWDDIEFISEEEYNKRIQRKKPEKGDVIYTREGAILGIAAVIDKECNVALGQRAMLLSPDANQCNSIFLCNAMNCDSFLANALKGQSGSASPHINVGDIKAFKMIMPPIKLQQQFAAFVAQVDKSKFVVQKSLQELETLKKSLMQQYFG